MLIRHIWGLLLVCLSLTLCAGCSKTQERDDAIFIGKWTGIATNTEDSSDQRALTINIPKHDEWPLQMLFVACDAIPAYRRVEITLEHPDLKDGAVLISLGGSGGHDVVARVICERPYNDLMDVMLDVTHGAEYKVTLRRIK